MDHLIQGRRDQTGQPDHVCLLFSCGLQNLFARNHHTQIDHFVVIATQDDADDVLADVVHIAFDRRHDNPAAALVLPAPVASTSGLPRGFHKRKQVGNSLLHDAGALDHLG